MNENLQIKSQKDRPKVGVVLAGLGVRAVSFIPLFEFLEEENIEVDLFAASSTGARIRALNGIGYTSEQIVAHLEEWLSKKPYSRYDYKSILSIFSKRFAYKEGEERALYRRSYFLNELEKVFGDHRLEDLKPRTILQATDIYRNNGVVLKEGKLSEAVYASSAFYPFIPPINIDDQWLIDGGYSNPVPATELVKEDIDVIIVMWCMDQVHKNPQKFYKGFQNCVSISSKQLLLGQLALAVNMHHFEMIHIEVKINDPFTVGDKSQIPELLKLGKEALEKKKEEIRKAIESYVSK